MTPLERDDVVICRGVPDAAIGILRFAVALCAGELESVTFTVNEKFPAVVGVPLICPEALKVRPAGRVPVLMDQLYCVFPPLAATVAEYAVFVTPPGKEEVVMCTGVALAVIVIPRVVVALCAGELESVTATVNEDVPAVVGVPLTCPALLSVSPAGSDPELIDQL